MEGRIGGPVIDFPPIGTTWLVDVVVLRNIMLISGQDSDSKISVSPEVSEFRDVILPAELLFGASSNS